MTYRNIAAALCAATLCLPAQASTLSDRYSGFVAFGDSLSDPGNLFALTGQPGDPYEGGRFSNGPVWAEDVAAAFGTSQNYAFGGAKAASDADGIPDLIDQIGLFDLDGVGGGGRAALGARPLASVWLGANDLFGAVPPGSPSVETAVGDAIDALRAGIGALRDRNIDDFLLFDLPDLGKTPLYRTVLPFLSGAGTAATTAFNAALAALEDELTAAGARVRTISSNAFFAQVLDDPGALGFDTVRRPCHYISGDALVQAAADVARTLLGDGRSCDDPETRAFFDLVHPNATFHQAFAQDVLDQIAPVPAPAGLPLLLTGLGTLAWARRRARRRVAA